LSISYVDHSNYEILGLALELGVDKKGFTDRFAQLRVKVNNYPFLDLKAGVEKTWMNGFNF
jgi:hypothetical protein